MSLEHLYKYIEGSPRHFSQPAGVEVYEYLAEVSKDYANISDLGTDMGFSALALSNNEKSRIISYDMDLSKLLVKDKKNITFVLGNIFDYIDDIIKSDLIYLDIDPHDGIQEENFINVLEKKKYKGIVIADDIHLKRYPKMVEWWNNVKQRKEDVTEKGHWSGTGIIYFE